MVFGLFALATAAIFFGAAFYVNFAEQSARLSLDDRSLLVEWKPAYASPACCHRLCQHHPKTPNAPAHSKMGNLHAVRTALGLAATLIFISASLR